MSVVYDVIQLQSPQLILGHFDTALHQVEAADKQMQSIWLASVCCCEIADDKRCTHLLAVITLRLYFLVRYLESVWRVTNEGVYVYFSGLFCIL